jgi:signal transduction histidine kinase
MMKSFSVGHRLYLSVLAVFLIFAVSFIIFQWNRERYYKIVLLESKLQDFNGLMNGAIHDMGGIRESELDKYVKSRGIKDIRVTLLDNKGRVLFDNVRKNYASLPNHAGRPEIVQAIKTGQGSTVERNSATLNHDYFYVATYFAKDSLVIRAALPYNNNLTQLLKADMHFIWFAIIAVLVLTLVLYRFVNRLGTNITKLKIFAVRAEHNESLDIEDLADFPDDELGEIAEKIIKIYKRLQSTRQEQDVLKRQLTQNIAHELKTPVASIQGYLETIIDNPCIESSVKQQFLERCYAQSERLASLLKDISMLNRMDDAPEMQELEEVDIVELVHSIEKETALQMEERDMTFDNQLPSELKLRGNRSLLYSIFRNLTDNAISYAGKGTTITLKAERDSDSWKFMFSDNGVGVAVEHLPRLFERFYRVDKGRSRKMGGTGLGLAIVKNAVLLHQGSIRANTSPQGGLVFTFSLSTDFSSSENCVNKISQEGLALL